MVVPKMVLTVRVEIRPSRWATGANILRGRERQSVTRQNFFDIANFFTPSTLKNEVNLGAFMGGNTWID